MFFVRNEVKRFHCMLYFIFLDLLTISLVCICVRICARSEKSHKGTTFFANAQGICYETYEKMTKKIVF